MSDYIDRKRAADFLCKIICGSDRGLCVSTPENCRQKRMLEFFELPAADVVPVVRGKFIELDIDDETKPSKFQCSACLHTEELFMITPEELEWKYCPHCGADMREDTFALYQIKTGPDFARFRFMNMDWLRQNGETVRPERYKQQYSATLDSSASDQEALEEIFCRLNERRYDDYDGPSMSVSDVVVLSRAGKKSAWYCDSVGFQEVPEFLEGYHHA